MDENPHAIATERPSEHELVSTLFDLGRQVAAELDFNELLQQIPKLLSRLIAFEAFAVYLLDERRGELRVAGAIGYPPRESPYVLKAGQGLVGVAITEQRPVVVDDASTDPRYVQMVPGIHSALVVPLLHKGKAIGALNI